MQDSMSSKQIKSFIKQTLKKNGYTYADMAEVLELSEASVKRIMNTEDLSLNRLEIISNWFGMSVFDFIDKAREYKPDYHYFSEEQELYLSQNPEALYITILLSTGLPQDQVFQRSQLEQKTFTKYIEGLKNIKIIEFWGKAKIKINYKGPFLMRESGPLANKMTPLLVKSCLENIKQVKKNDLLKSGEVYMTQGLLDKLRKEHLDMFNKYFMMAKLEQDLVDSSELLPVTILTFISEFELWKDVLLKKKTD